MRRLICHWITLGDFWLSRSQPGQTAAESGDRGLKQMAWINQGESTVLGECVFVCVPELGTMLEYGNFCAFTHKCMYLYADACVLCDL